MIKISSLGFNKPALSFRNARKVALAYTVLREAPLFLLTVSNLNTKIPQNWHIILLLIKH